MTASAATKLYTPELLALATGLAEFPLTDGLTARAEARSRSCGSVVAIGLGVDRHGKISAIGLKVSACAIGQASAALLAKNVTGVDAEHIHITAGSIADWLSGQGDLPRWPGIEALAPAREHPGRHGALILPWTAACEALSHYAPGR